MIRLPAPRLALRVWLVGLLQTASIVGAFFFFAWLYRSDRPGPAHAHARYVLVQVAAAAAGGDRDRLAQVVDEAQSVSGAQVWVTDPSGAHVAGSSTPRVCLDVAPGDRRAPPCARQTVETPTGPVLVEVRAPGGPPPGDLGTKVLLLAVLVVVITGWLLARSVTVPLARLSAATRAFGAGDRTARTGVVRRDELGQVATTFDEMADRVTQLLRAEKELLANVSHELRTPLARIRVALDLAAEGDADTLQESLADIAVDLAELERLIADVLTAARLDLDDGPGSSGLPPLRRQPIAATELLAQAAGRFRAANPGRALEVEEADDLPTIDVDAVLVRRVIDNLLDNAHQYSPDPAAPIVLRASRGEGALTLVVEDRGVGIAADDLPRLFRPFYRADRSRTRATGGLGLGLALARRIVEAHGGSVALTSRLGEGTTVTVTLPAPATASQKR